MRTLDDLFKNNREWAERIRRQDPEFFAKLSRQQSPTYLWIGCADSRVPANQIVGLLPGDIFVHRNIANMVVHTDLNCLSVMQFAVDILKVKHIIVVGPLWLQRRAGRDARARASASRTTGCATCRTCTRSTSTRCTACDSENAASDRLCELNVIEQVQNVCQTTIARDAWERGQELHVHGWIYGIADGLARDLGTTVSDFREAAPIYQAALAKLAETAHEARRTPGANYLTTLSCGRRLPSSGGAGLVGGSGPRSCSENTMPSPVSRA